jgi:hypothetical protein
MNVRNLTFLICYGNIGAKEDGMDGTWCAHDTGEKVVENLVRKKRMSYVEFRLKLILNIILVKYVTEYVRFAVFMAVAMKNGVFWDIKNEFVPHRRHITFPLQSPAS